MAVVTDDLERRDPEDVGDEPGAWATEDAPAPLPASPPAERPLRFATLAEFVEEFLVEVSWRDTTAKRRRAVQAVVGLHRRGSPARGAVVLLRASALGRRVWGCVGVAPGPRRPASGRPPGPERSLQVRRRGGP